MPAVCRFYLKGNCRYGRSCRFEHPGEDNNDDYNNKSTSKFSFAKALEETTKPANFSFARALEESTYNPYPFANNQQQFYTSTPYHFNSGHQQHSHTGFNYPHNQSVGPFSQTYHHQQQYHNNSLGNFSFVAALASTNEDPTLRHNSLNNYASQSFYQDHTNKQCIDEIDMRPPGEQNRDNIDLTEVELKAYQSDKFQFRLIPIRPPPRDLCF